MTEPAVPPSRGRKRWLPCPRHQHMPTTGWFETANRRALVNKMPRRRPRASWVSRGVGSRTPA